MNIYVYKTERNRYMFYNICNCSLKDGGVMCAHRFKELPLGLTVNNNFVHKHKQIKTCNVVCSVC